MPTLAIDKGFLSDLAAAQINLIRHTGHKRNTEYVGT
jgi:hypothetical protein